MSESKRPGILNTSTHSHRVPARSPGPLGHRDQGDPNVLAFLGNTPGLLGSQDWAVVGSHLNGVGQNIISSVDLVRYEVPIEIAVFTLLRTVSKGKGWTPKKGAIISGTIDNALLLIQIVVASFEVMKSNSEQEYTSAVNAAAKLLYVESFASCAATLLGTTGAEAGAAVGAAAGAPFALVGAAPGAIIGGVIFGTVAAFEGVFVGSRIAGQIYDSRLADPVTEIASIYYHDILGNFD